MLSLLSLKFELTEHKISIASFKKKLLLSKIIKVNAFDQKIACIGMSQVQCIFKIK